jgi:hypothetical protein
MSEPQSELASIATEGYVFLYPLVTTELTRRQTANIARALVRAVRASNDLVLQVSTLDDKLTQQVLSG